MNRIHPRRNRIPRFEGLEERLTLSTGVGIGAISNHAHALVMSPAQRQAPASFRGHLSQTATTFTITHLTGTIGRDRFVGYASGTQSATIVQGGDIYLSSKYGTIHLMLSPATVTQVGKHTRQTVPAVAVAATGKYALYVGDMGTLKAWTVPSRPNGTASFSGVFNLT